MTSAEVVQKLDSFKEGDDNERVHVTADKILIKFLSANGHSNIGKAYERLRKRVGFFYI